MSKSGFFNTSGTSATTETNIQTSVDAAAASATAAASSETDAQTAQAAAEAARNASQTAQSASETAKTASEAARDAAQVSQNAAATSASGASTSASTATTQANNASTSASTATTKASEATTSATNAATSASTATTQASTATTKASEASTSATNAASSASTASTQASNASTSASTASTQASNAASSASTASGHASTATTKASEAATSATNAATSASTASTQATNAGNSATAAASSASAASTSASNAASSLNSFNAVYSTGSSDPTSNLDTGDLFYNQSSGLLKVYTGSVWEQGVTAGSGFLPLTGSGLTGNFTTTGLIDGRDVAADGTKLDGIEASADVTDTTNVVAALTAGTGITIAGNGTIASTASSDLVDDTSPQLGGALDVQTHSIVSTSNRDITIDPNGIGDIVLDANVGIGTATPAFSRTGGGLRIDNSDAPHIRLDNGSSNVSEIYQSGANTVIDSRSPSGVIKLTVQDSEKMRLTSGGFVGIGDSAPNVLLSVKGSAAQIALDSTDGEPMVRFRDTGSTRALLKIDSTNNMEFHTGPDGAVTELMSLTPAGSLGIGTSPSTLLHLNSSSDPVIRLQRGGGAYSQIVSATGGELFLMADAGNSGSSSRMQFNVDGSERMRIDTSGNVLVGTTSFDGDHSNDSSGNGLAITPSGKIDVKVHGTVANFNRTSSADGELLKFAKQGAEVGTIRTYGGDLAIGTGDTGLRFIDGSNAIAPSNIGSNTDVDNSIDLGYASRRFQNGFFSNYLYANYFAGVGDTNTLIEFPGNNVMKFVTGGGERARITSSGAFVVAKTANNTDKAGFEVTSNGATAATRASGHALLVNRLTDDGSVIIIRRQGTTVGTIAVTSSGTTYNTDSDIRLKQDIEPLEATDKLMQMNPVSYSWKADPDGQRSMGFIAQEMQSVCPEAVSTGDGEDAMLSMDYGRITPILVSALQDAHRKIEQLESRVAAMESK